MRDGDKTAPALPPRDDKENNPNADLNQKIREGVKLKPVPLEQKNVDKSKSGNEVQDALNSAMTKRRQAVADDDENDSQKEDENTKKDDVPVPPVRDDAGLAAEDGVPPALPPFEESAPPVAPPSPSVTKNERTELPAETPTLADQLKDRAANLKKTPSTSDSESSSDKGGVAVNDRLLERARKKDLESSEEQSDPWDED